jgi:hypothetical protein
MRGSTRLGLLLAAVLVSSSTASSGDDERPKSEADAKLKRERLLEIYRREGEGYTLYRDGSRAQKLELRRAPVYVWTNQVRSGGQDGAVFVWTARGRAEVIGSFFSFPFTGPRFLYHEFHSLATTVLDVTRAEGEHEWKPQAPGIELAPIADAPAPATSAPRRLAQMRALTTGFSAHSEDKKGQQWDLRLLPQPLYRYESTDPEVLDGAVFAFVTSAGTDPEILLVLEARRTHEGTGHAWRYALARFSDLKLWVRYQGKDVFAAESIPWNSPQQDPQDRYRCFRDRQIPPVEEEAP